MASTPDNSAPCGGKHGDTWRLSRIEEELEKIEFHQTSNMANTGPVILPGAKAGTLPRRSAQTSQYTWGNEAPPDYSTYSGQAFHNQYYGGSSSTPNLDDPDEIYSKAVIKPAYSGDKVLDSKEAVKFLTGKYDSLGRLKPMMATLSGVSSPQSLSGDLSNGSFGSADFPPPPPEGFAQMPNAAMQGPQHLSSPSCSPSKSPQHRPTSARSHSVQMENENNASYHVTDGNQIPPLTEQELVQIEMFYRSHKSEVFVCQSLVNMYFGSIRSSGSPLHSPCRTEPGHWEFFKSGIPVLVLDSGESRRKRRLHINLAERGTGFSMWREPMSHLTNYTSPQSTFHTMHLSNDHTKLAGFRFVDAAAALEFFHRIMNLVADPNDDILNLGSGKGKKRFWGKSKDKKKKLPTKGDISSPCCFTHITKLDRTDGMSMLTAPAPPPQQQHREQPTSPGRPGHGGYNPQVPPSQHTHRDLPTSPGRPGPGAYPQRHGHS